VRETLVLDELERLVILSASKRRRQILEGERGCVLALQEGDQVPRREKPAAVLLLQSFPLAPLYREPRVLLNTLCGSLAIIRPSRSVIHQTQDGKNYQRREGENEVERDGHGHDSPRGTRR
jgi:hypothetical protein